MRKIIRLNASKPDDSAATLECENGRRCVGMCACQFGIDQSQSLEYFHGLDFINKTRTIFDFAKVHFLHTEAIRTALGERFNIFEILEIGHLETKTHSPFLAHLLDPTGGHGQGPLFLRLFIGQFPIHDFDPCSARVKTEHYIGPKTDRTGGRLDISLKDGKSRAILIENKIYAGEQERQMDRYREFNKHAYLLFLTLDGRVPSNVEAQNMRNIICVSYATDILLWLRRCRSECPNAHTVRETLNQYIRLIERLTNQSTKLDMDKKLIDEIANSAENFKAFTLLTGAMGSVRTEILKKFDRQLENLASEMTMRKLPAEDLTCADAGFAFSTPSLDASGFTIRFVFVRSNLRDLYFGFTHNSKEPSQYAKELKKKFAESFTPQETSSLWPAGRYWDEYRNWNDETFLDILNDKLAIELRGVLTKLLYIAKEVFVSPDA